MILLEFIEIFVSESFDVLDIEKQAEPKFYFHLCFLIVEGCGTDGRNVESVGDYSLHQQLIVLFGPVVPLLGVEVDMVEGVVFVAYFRPG